MNLTRPRGPSLWRRGLRALSALTVAALAVGAGTVLGVTAAHAAPNAEISIIPLANANSPHGQFDPFQYNVIFSCSDTGSAGCTDMQIRVPVTLEPRAGQVERFASWTMSAQLSGASSASFSQAWETSGTTRTLVLTARNTIPAGVQESLALTIQPPNWVGDDVRFTVGAAQLTTTNGDPATSNSHTATVTNIALHQPTLSVTGGYTPSPADNRQIVTYSFDPMINNILTQSGAAHLFGIGDLHSAATPNVTAQYETISLTVDIPSGGSYVPSTGSGSNSYQTTVTGNRLTFTLPANQLPTNTIQFTVEYPASMAGQSVCPAANRTFTATNGELHDDDVESCHLLDMRPIPEGNLGKCGHGGVSMNAMQLVGMCSSSVMVPGGWTTQGLGQPSTGRYAVKMTEMREGDTVSFTDFMPCFDRPGTSVLTESFESQQVCANPAVRITSVTAGVEPINTSQLQNITDDVSYQLINNDGTITSAVTRVTDAFPAAPASGHWTGIRLTIENFPRIGTAIGTIHVEALPGVDREMMLENYASAEVTRAANGSVSTYPKSPVGVIRVVDVTSATARSNLGYAAGSTFATISGSYTIGRLDPGVALPVNTLQLPAGFDVQNGDLSSFTVQYNGAGTRYALTDHFTVTVVPEDTATNTGPRLVMTPIPGTVAVPTNGAGWPTVSVQGRMVPTWGEWNTRQTVTAAISVGGDARQISTCTGGATRVGADLIDRDGDGVTDADVSCEWSTSALLGIPNVAATAVATKGVRNVGDSNWTTGAMPVTTSTSSIEYLLTWRNAGQPTLDDVVMYDLLPTVGDHGATSVTAGAARGSTFEPVFTGIIGTVPAGMQIAYSASANPCRSEILPTNPGCDNGWVPDAADIGGAANVRALRLTMPGAQVSGTAYSLVFGMEIPAATAVDEVAWNTVAHRAVLSGQPMTPAETARVGALVPASVPVSEPAISVDKVSTNVTEGAAVLSGTLVNWDYVLTNTGTEDLTIGTVVDSRGVIVGCPTRDLPIGESITCSGQGRVAGDPRYTNVATVTAVGALGGRTVTATDTWTTPIEQLSVALEVVKTAENVAEHSELSPNQQVVWNYTVTNTGTDTIASLTVTDDREVPVVCPSSIDLAPGESVTCTGTGTVGYATSYTNVATAIGTGGFTAATATDTDDWSATVLQPEVGIQIDKSAVGLAETDTVVQHTVVTWEYAVTNSGAEPIEGIVVTDDQGVRITCPAGELAAGASMTCTGSGSVGSGERYTNIGSVTGRSTHTGREVSADDPWTVAVRDLIPSLSIVKGASNAIDGGSVLAGTTVHWNYTVQNTGEEAIEQLAVTDDRGVEVACPVTELAIGEITTCTGSARIGNVGSYTNIGTATGAGVETGTAAEATDAWETDVEEPSTSAVMLKSSTEYDRGATLMAGTEVTWHYQVTNSGSETLVNISVTDDRGVDVVCPAEALAPGESMTCVGSGSVGDGANYTNIGTIAAVGEVTGHETVGDDSWTVTLVSPMSEGPETEWPNAPVGGHMPTQGGALEVTGGLGLGVLGAAGLVALVLGLVLLAAQRRRATS